MRRSAQPSPASMATSSCSASAARWGRRSPASPSAPRRRSASSASPASPTRRCARSSPPGAWRPSNATFWIATRSRRCRGSPTWCSWQAASSAPLGDDDLTWAMNTYVPAVVAETFHASRIVAFSTGCVYPFVDVRHQGAVEETPPTPPPGEYANSCVGRERMIQYFSRRHGTPGRLVRLNYAIDMRYGVLHDVARKVRDDGCRSRSPRATSTSSGRGTPTRWRCAASSTAPCPPSRSM